MSKRSGEEAIDGDRKKAKTEQDAVVEAPQIDEESMKVLMSIDSDMTKIDKAASSEMFKIQVKATQDKSPLYVKRQVELNKIEGFWGKVLTNALEMFASISVAESDFLREYVSELIVDDALDSAGNYRITLKLSDEAEGICEPLVLVKEVTVENGNPKTVTKKTMVTFKKTESDVFVRTQEEQKVLKEATEKQLGDVPGFAEIDVPFESLLKWFNEDINEPNASEDSDDEEDDQNRFDMIIKSNVWASPLSFFSPNLMDDEDSDSE